MKGQLEITLINKRVRNLESDPKAKAIEERLEKNKTQFSLEVEALRMQNIELKIERKEKRARAKLLLNKLEYTKVNEALKNLDWAGIDKYNQLNELQISKSSPDAVFMGDSITEG